MSDLTDEEQERVRTALQFLEIRCGDRNVLAKALRFMPHSLRHVLAGRSTVSATMVLRVARLAQWGSTICWLGDTRPRGCARIAGMWHSLSRRILKESKTGPVFLFDSKELYH